MLITYISIDKQYCYMVLKFGYKVSCFFKYYAILPPPIFTLANKKAHYLRYKSCTFVERVLILWQ